MRSVVPLPPCPLARLSGKLGAGGDTSRQPALTLKRYGKAKGGEAQPAAPSMERLQRLKEELFPSGNS